MARMYTQSIGNILGTLEMPLHPMAVAVHHASKRIFVASSGNLKDGGDSPGSITVIDGEQLSVVQTIALPTDVAELAVDQVYRRVLVLLVGPYGDDGEPYKPGHLAVFDTLTGVQLQMIEVGIGPQALAVNDSGEYAVVANGLDDTASVVDLHQGTITRQIRVGFEPIAVVIAESNGHAFVANYSGNTVSTLNMQTGDLLETVQVGKGPQSLVVSADGRYVFAACYWGDVVAVLDAASGKLIRLIPTAKGPSKLLFDAGTKRVFVLHLVTGATANRVSVINAETLEFVEPAQWSEPLLGEHPAWGTLDPTTRCVYVANVGSGSVTIFDADAAFNTPPLLKTVAVGRLPRSVAIAPELNKCFVVCDSGLRGNKGQDMLWVLDSGALDTASL